MPSFIFTCNCAWSICFLLLLQQALVCYISGDSKYQERQFFRNENNIVEISSAEIFYSKTISFG